MPFSVHVHNLISEVYLFQIASMILDALLSQFLQ